MKDLSELPYAYPRVPYSRLYDPRSIGEGISSLHGNKKYSDLSIVCQDHTFYVHKVIVCMQSKVFAAMLAGPYKEATNASIKLEDEDPKTVELLIQFLYKHEYYYSPPQPTANHQSTTPTSGNGDDSTSFAMHARMFLIADKYDIPNLATSAYHQYYMEWESVDLHLEWEECFKFLRSIPYVYGVPARKDDGVTLRTLASRIMYSHNTDIQILCQNSNELKELRETTLRDNPEFMYDVMLLLMAKPTPVCTECATKDTDGCSYYMASIPCSTCEQEMTYCRAFKSSAEAG